MFFSSCGLTITGKCKLRSKHHHKVENMMACHNPNKKFYHWLKSVLIECNWEFSQTVKQDIHSPFKFGTVSIVSKMARLFMSYMYVFSCKTTTNLHIQIHYFRKKRWAFWMSQQYFQQIGTTSTIRPSGLQYQNRLYYARSHLSLNREATTVWSIASVTQN